MAPHDQKRLPLKVVLTSERDLRRPAPGGSERKVFGDVSVETRKHLKAQFLKVERFFAPVFEREPNVPAVARIILKQDALAKSHRPSGLLNENTCPVIGVRSFGELLVSVQPERIRQLVERIVDDGSKVTVANLSTIERIEPYTEADVSRSPGWIRLAKRAYENAPVKLKLFRHGRPALDHAVYESFQRLIGELGAVHVDPLDYGRGVTIYRIKGVKPGPLKNLARFVGAQSLSEFPTFRFVKTASLPVRAVVADEFPPPDPNVEYPVVGIVDSGIPTSDPALVPWVAGRHEYVLIGDRDHSHGSFVGGLLAHARQLNQGDPRFPGVSSRIVDVVALPKGGGITEDELIAILDEVVPQHPEVRIWNLSLGTPFACSDTGFSDLGIKLDDLQDRYDVTFVLAAGNYEVKPFRGWPAENFGEADRICSPADSVRGATVASIAHIARPNSRVQNEEPSPFSDAAQDRSSFQSRS